MIDIAEDKGKILRKGRYIFGVHIILKAVITTFDPQRDGLVVGAALRVFNPPVLFRRPSKLRSWLLQTSVTHCRHLLPVTGDPARRGRSSALPILLSLAETLPNGQIQLEVVSPLRPQPSISLFLESR